MGLTIGYWGWSDGKKGMLRPRLHLHSCVHAGVRYLGTTAPAEKWPPCRMPPTFDLSH